MQPDEWITVNGNHIPIMPGQTKEEAVKNEFKKEPKNINGKKKNFDKKPKNVSGEEKKEAKREPKKEQPRREQKPEPVVVERSEEEIKAIKQDSKDKEKEEQERIKEIFQPCHNCFMAQVMHNKWHRCQSHHFIKNIHCQQIARKSKRRQDTAYNQVKTIKTLFILLMRHILKRRNAYHQPYKCDKH